MNDNKKAVLNYLRDTTKLTRADKRKINRERNNSYSDAKFFEEKEGYFPGVDFDRLTQTEYDVLFNRVKDGARELYQQIGTGLSEDEFAERVIASDMVARQKGAPKVRKRSRLKLFNPMDYNFLD